MVYIFNFWHSLITCRLSSTGWRRLPFLSENWQVSIFSGHNYYYTMSLMGLVCTFSVLSKKCQHTDIFQSIQIVVSMEPHVATIIQTDMVWVYLFYATYFFKLNHILFMGLILFSDQSTSCNCFFSSYLTLSPLQSWCCCTNSTSVAKFWSKAHSNNGKVEFCTSCWFFRWITYLDLELFNTWLQLGLLVCWLILIQQWVHNYY